MATATKTRTKSGKAASGRKKKTTKPVTFLSRSPNQRLTFEPGEIIRNERGRVIETIPSRSIEFEDRGLGHGTYVWDPSDEGREDWERSEEFLTWLREHPKINTGREGAFWERGAAPDEPEPKLFKQMDAIMKASAAGDADAIEDVLRTERETQNRDLVLETGEAALARLSGEGGGTDD